MGDALPAELKNGRYAVVRLLAEGAQAQTLEGVDKQLGRSVAIKRFFVRGAKRWKDVELAEREARVLASLSHPHLPAYVDYFEEDGALCLVMDRIEGESLAEARARGALLGIDDVWSFLADSADVLAYLHGRAPPVIHRDIKPGNVIRRPDGSFVLVDFGSVRDKLKPSGGSTVVGTFGYMAPEQFQGRALPATDVYAVAATALVMLTGVEPEDLPHRGLAIDVSAALRGRAPPDLVRVLAAMLDPDPDRRASSIAPLLPARRNAERRARHERPHRERRHREHHRRPPREHDWPARVRGGEPLPLFVIALFTVGLIVARVSVSLTLRVVLPFIWSLLSIFFGPALRRGARKLMEAGNRADRVLAQTLRNIHARAHEMPIDTEGVELPTEVVSPPYDARARVVSEPLASSDEDEAPFDAGVERSRRPR